MDEVHVDPLDAEPAEAPLDLAPNPPGGETPIVGVALDRMEDLGAQQHVRAACRTPPADPRLAAPTPVRVGRVEEVDAESERGVHQLERLGLALAPAEELRRGADAPEVAAAEREARERQTGAAERPPLDRHASRCRWRVNAATTASTSSVEL